MRSGAAAAIPVGRRVQGNSVNANQPFDVLEPPLAHVFENQVQSLSNVIAYGLRNCDPSRRGNAFQSRGYIDAVAQDVIPFHNDIAQIDADPEFNSGVGRHAAVPSPHCSLNAHGAVNGAHYTWKLGQDAIAGQFHDPAVMFGDFPFDNVGTQLF